MAQDIKLNFINQSNDRNNSEVVIFQKNVATSYEEIAVAWLVIQNCGQGFNHPFTYPMQMTISAADSYGNFSPQLSAYNGQQFSMVRSLSGDSLQYSGASADSNEIEILNALETGSIDGGIYRNGKLLAIKTGISPSQKAVFRFNPTIFIGVVSQVQEGQVMDSAIISNINTELSLQGIASADIVMTGGGTGAGATPFKFSLQNITYA
jgi:hypothetical protein